MPFYIRKSVSAGPFRFNFSKGGVGVSVGIKGLRIGTGPRGHYIHAGRGGLYYRATLGKAGRSRPSAAERPLSPSPQMTFDDGDVPMTEIESGDVMHMQDESFTELLNEVNSKAGQIRMSAALAWTGGIFGLLAGLAIGGPGLFLCILALPGWAIGKWLDSYRRSTVLYYDLEGDAQRAYSCLAAGFDGLAGCAAKWHIEAGGAVQNLTAWKRNAGASHLVNRKATILAYNLPSVIKSNVTPPALQVGKQVMFFMPDIVLVQDGSRVGAVNYADLNVRWQDSRFIETERVPSDAKVVDHTWKHPNKSGGPDRRFKDNRQIPICLYEAIHFTSNSGVNELVEFSRTGVAGPFADGCRMLGALPRGRTAPPPPFPAIAAQEVATQNADASGSTPEITPVRTRNPIRTVAVVCLGLFLGVPVLGIVLGSREPASKTDSSRSATLNTPMSAPTAVSPPLPAQDAAPAPPPPAPTTGFSSSSTAAATVSTSENLAKPVLPATDLGAAPEPAAHPVSATTSAVKYTRTAVNLRAGPGTKFAIVTVVQKGAEVLVLEVRGGWSRVHVNDTTAGWMANSTVANR